MNLVPTNPDCNELKHWIFRLYKGPFYVRLQGYRESKGKVKKLECWLTSPIMQWEDSRTLISISGCRYVLKGSIDIELASIYQYPSYIINVFRNGFPDNWERILRPLHKMMNFDPTINRMINFSPIKPSLSNKFLPIAENSRKPLKNQTPKEINDTSVVYSTPIIVEIESTPLAPKSKCRDLVPLKKNEGALQVTRSGRVIKPRLQKSGGERIAYDIYGNPIAAYCVTTNAPNKPDYSEKLASICDGLGVSRLEHSKQTHRLSVAFDTPKLSGRLNKSGTKRKKIVDYSSSEDSFCAFVDQISLPSDSENEIPNSFLLNKSNDDFETPIRYKNLHANRIIQSASKSVKKMKLEKSQKFKIKKPIALPVFTIKNKQNSKIESFENILPDTPKKKRWTADDTRRLKIALKAAGNPQTIQDWNAIARSVSAGDRSGEECREQAIKIKWKPSKVLVTPEQSFFDQSVTSVQEKKCRSIRNKKNITGKNNADFFTEKNYDMSLLELDLNDSLLSVLKTPKEEAKFIRKPFLMEQVLNETRRSLRSNGTLDESLF